MKRKNSGYKLKIVLADLLILVLVALAVIAKYPKLVENLKNGEPIFDGIDTVTETKTSSADNKATGKGYTDANISRASGNGFDDTNKSDASGNGFADPNETNATGEGFQDPDGGRIKFSDQVEDLISEMTLEQKVAQLFILTPEQLTGVENATEAGTGTQTALSNRPVGGLVYSNGNYISQDQVKQMLSNTQQYAQEIEGFDLFLITQELGGSGSSALADLAAVEQAQSQASIGANMDEYMVYDNTGIIASYLADYGFNMNLGPVADVATGDMVNDNVFDTDSDLAAADVRYSVMAYTDDNLWSAAVNFPVKYETRESGDALPACTKSLADLQVQEYVVYGAAIDAGVSAIQMSNVTCEELTGDSNLSCSLSEKAIEEVRSTLSFTNGIIISDALNNSYVEEAFPDGQAAVQALEAGCDMLYLPTDYETSYNAVLAAVDDRTIDEDDIDQAVGRILTVKLNSQE